jgi:hypothetical protein
MEVEAAMSASASDATASLPVTAGIPISLFQFLGVRALLFFVAMVVGGAVQFNPIWPEASRKSPCEEAAGAASLVAVGADDAVSRRRRR